MYMGKYGKELPTPEQEMDSRAEPQANAGQSRGNFRNSLPQSPVSGLAQTAPFPPLGAKQLWTMTRICPHTQRLGAHAISYGSEPIVLWASWLTSFERSLSLSASRPPSRLPVALTSPYSQNTQPILHRGGGVVGGGRGWGQTPGTWPDTVSYSRTELPPSLTDQITEKISLITPC